MIALALALLAQEPLTLEAYRGRAAAVAKALEAGDVYVARREALALLEIGRVSDGAGEVGVDENLFKAASEVADPAAARALAPRAAALAEALGDGPSSDRPPDLERLERARRAQEVETAKKGGRVASAPSPDLPESLLERLGAAFRWIGNLIADVWEWIMKTFFGRKSGSKSGDGGGMPVFVIVLALALTGILAFVAVLAWRRRRAEPRALAAVSLPAAAARDEDPLSRGASEWERFAAELARAGRYREAIRAWYHAALVSLFRAGLIHYRKERTIWDYAFALPAQLPASPAFQDMTRDFEREWYGRRETSAEVEAEFEGRARSVLDALRGGPR